MQIIGLCGYTGVGKDEAAKYLVAKHGYTRVAFADAMREDLYKLNPIIINGELLNVAYQQILSKGFLSPEDYHVMKLAGVDLLTLLTVDWDEDAFADKLVKREISSHKIIEIAANGYFEVRRLVEAVDRYGWDDAKRIYPEIRRLLQVYGTEVGRDGFGDDVWIDRAIAKIKKAEKVVVTDVRFENEVAALRKLGATIVHVWRPGHGPINGHASEQLRYEEVRDLLLVNDSDVESFQGRLDGLLEFLSSPTPTNPELVNE